MSAWIQLESDRLGARISPLGGAIVDGHTTEGVPFLRPYQGKAEFDAGDCACFPLVPIGKEPLSARRLVRPAAAIVSKAMRSPVAAGRSHSRPTPVIRCTSMAMAGWRHGRSESIGPTASNWFSTSRAMSVRPMLVMRDSHSGSPARAWNCRYRSPIQARSHCRSASAFIRSFHARR